MGKRILVFNDCFHVGGTEILLINLLNHLVDKKHEVTLLLPNPSDDDILLERISPQVKVEYIFNQKPEGIKDTLYRNILIFTPRLYQYLIGFDESRYDKIICFKDCFYSIMFSKMKNIQKYLWIQNHPFKTIYNSKSVKEYFAFILNRFQISRRNKSFDKFDKIICVSDSSKREYIKIYNKGVRQRELIVLYNALDLSGIAQRAEESIALDDFTVPSFAIVIRLSHEKTVDRAIKATDRLRAEGYNFKIIILGDGAEYDNLQKLITSYNLADYITMFGRVPNPFPYMKKCDWLLCPSSRESFSLVLLEAISLGTPVITTDCGGPEDVIDRGNYGVFTENSLEGVYSAMKKVLDDPSLLAFYQSKKEENLVRFDYNRWIKSVDLILEIE